MKADIIACPTPTCVSRKSSYHCRPMRTLLLSTILAITLAAQAPPATPVVTPVPTSREVTGPGPVFAALQRLPADEDLAHFKYIVKEYFVSGTAQGQPYTTRVLVRRPADPKKFSGIVLAEPMHFTGNSWMFHFLHTYAMSEGHVSLEIVTGSRTLFTQANAERYKSLVIADGQANEILAQAGALVKSGGGSGPLEGLPMRKMILMGTSASAAAVTAYLPAHAAYRMPGMKPIFDGFLPTSIGGTSPIMKVDVPVVMMPTMTEIVAEAVNGNRYRRPDGDAPGDQFRIYEVAGMAHNDSRVNPVYDPDPCRYPVSRFPQGMGVSAGVERLIQWIDKGRIPPRADYVVVDNDTKNDGSVLALDAYGNPKGGVRSTYVDVPVKRYVSPNEPHPMPIPNPSPLTAVASVQLFCSIAGYEVPLTHEQVQPLYRNKKDYQSKVEKRVKELIKEGWLTPSYKELILSDAMKVSLP
jgi:hypothetical protein